MPVILFDVMSTLVNDPFPVELPAFFDMTLEELIEAKHPTAWAEFERSEIDETTFLDGFFTDRRAYDQRGMVDCMVRTYAWLDGMEDILREVGERGLDVHLFSNYPVWYRKIEEKLGLSRYAPWSFVSCHMGARKPSERAFAHVAEELHTAPSELVLIDDDESNCAGAEAAGWRAHRFTDAGSLRSALPRLVPEWT